MSDNVTTQSSTAATVPAGTVIATDDVGGVHFQKMKLDVGTDGNSSPVTASNPLPVTPSPTALTAASPTAATVGTGSAQAVASNSGRKGLTLTNTSVNRISLGFGATAVLDSGVTLQPGQAYEMSERDFTTAAVNAIASGSSSNLAVQEYS